MWAQRGVSGDGGGNSHLETSLTYPDTTCQLVASSPAGSGTSSTSPHGHTRVCTPVRAHTRTRTLDSPSASAQKRDQMPIYDGWGHPGQFSFSFSNHFPKQTNKQRQGLETGQDNDVDADFRVENRKLAVKKFELVMRKTNSRLLLGWKSKEERQKDVRVRGIYTL